MDAFDPENELIDRYLRGELHGQQLDSFMRKLERDPALKQEIEFRQLLVRGIQEHGSAQLKNYLRQRTSQKRGLIIGFRTWYYAAAAVGIILVCSVVIMFNLRQNASSKSEVAKQETIQETPSKTGIPNAPGVKSEAEKSKQENGIATIEPGIDNAPGDNSAGSAESEGVNMEMENSSNIITVASNIPVIPIRIDSPMESATMSRKQSASPIGNPPKRTGDARDTTLNDNQAEQIKTRLADNSKFRLNFYNTKDATPQVAANTKDPNNTEILVYNLPYDNPLLFTYQNKMYLRTGNKYYEIDISKDGARKVTAVTDQALLKVLGQ